MEKEAAVTVKKLKQANLPFNKTCGTEHNSEIIRKRKYEPDKDDASDVKTPKIANNEICQIKDEHPSNIINECNNVTSELATSESENNIEMIEVDSNSSNENSALSSTTISSSTKIKVKKKLTPKQLLRRQEIERKREERNKLREEKLQKKLQKEKEKQIELEAKAKEKKLKEEEKIKEKRLREEERRQKEEEKLKEKKLREEEKRQKEEERLKEKKLREEERRQKEEEKRLKEEEKQLREEERKAEEEYQKEKFRKFFLLKTVQSKTDAENLKNNSMFKPFEVKVNMKLADINRVKLSSERLSKLDDIIYGNHEYDENVLYLSNLKTKDYKPGHSENTWPLNFNDYDTTTDETSPVKIKKISAYSKKIKYRCKLLQFHDNRRPPYWGTWRKESKIITGRSPFKCDAKFFDYEIDSDDEWEEEPGESLHGSDDEKESEDDYEVDNDIFVPHGYLSDEEEQKDETEEKQNNSSPKSQKLKLSLLEKQFEAERREKTSKLKPRIYGCIRIKNGAKFNEKDSAVENILLSFCAVYNAKRTPFVIPKTKKLNFSSEVPTTVTSFPNTSGKIKLTTVFPESLEPDLAKFIHGSKKSSQKLAAEFNELILNQHTVNLSKTCITKKIKEISNWNFNLVLFCVKDEIRIKYDLEDLVTGNSQKSNDMEKVKKIDSEKLSISPATLNISPTAHNSKSKKSLITNYVKPVNISKNSGTICTDDTINKNILENSSSDRKVNPISSKQDINNVKNQTSFASTINTENKETKNTTKSLITNYIKSINSSKNSEIACLHNTENKSAVKNSSYCAIGKISDEKNVFNYKNQIHADTVHAENKESIISAKTISNINDQNMEIDDYDSREFSLNIPTDVENESNTNLPNNSVSLNSGNEHGTVEVEFTDNAKNSLNDSKVSKSLKTITSVSPNKTLSGKKIPTVRSLKNKTCVPLLTCTQFIKQSPKSSEQETCIVKSLTAELKNDDSKINDVNDRSKEKNVEKNQNKNSNSTLSPTINLVAKNLKNKVCRKLIPDNTDFTSAKNENVPNEKKSEKLLDYYKPSAKSSSDQESLSLQKNKTGAKSENDRVFPLRYTSSSSKLIPTVRSTKNKTCVPLITNYIPSTVNVTKEENGKLCHTKNNPKENKNEKLPLDFSNLISNIKSTSDEKNSTDTDLSSPQCKS